MPQPTAAARGVEVRGRLLAAAAELVPEIGWNAVSTRNLADRAGVAPGLVHYHFRSLRALLHEAVVAAMRELLAEMGPTFSETDPASAIEELLGQLDGYTGDDPTSLLFTEAFLAATRDDGLRAEIAALLDEFRGWLVRSLDAHGYVDPEATAAVLAAAIDGVLLHRVLNPALTAASVTPVLHRLLARPTTDRT